MPKVLHQAKGYVVFQDNDLVIYACGRCQGVHKISTSCLADLAVYGTPITPGCLKDRITLSDAVTNAVFSMTNLYLYESDRRKRRYENKKLALQATDE